MFTFRRYNRYRTRNPFQERTDERYEIAVEAREGGGGWYFLGGSQNTAAAADSAYTTAQVERRTITSTITGSGTLEAADSYSVTTLLEGTILTADFEEGDQVEEGTVLYTIDDSDAANSLEQAQISLNQSERSYQNTVESLEDLTVTADTAGRIYTLDVEVGDEVTAGQQVATIRDSDTMELTVPFPADDAAGFYVGQSATVTLDSTFETLTGTVSEISGNTEVLTGNMIVRNVTIDVSNPGGLSTSQSASATVNGVGSSSGGTFAYADEATVTADVAGTVSSISVAEGDQVSRGQTILQLTSDTLSEQVQSAEESLRNAQISYENQTEQLDDYTVTAPITGTIVDKNYNAGEITEANQVLCTIYDLSYLTMTLSVDELDIANIQVGQTVAVTADAVEAVLAAVYLDGGIGSARKLIQRFILDKEEEKSASRDYKTALQELVQRESGQVLSYRLTGESGPDHAKVFRVEVDLNGTPAGKGEGRSKKEAEQMAAKKALEMMGEA